MFWAAIGLGVLGYGVYELFFKAPAAPAIPSGPSTAAGAIKVGDFVIVELNPDRLDRSASADWDLVPNFPITPKSKFDLGTESRVRMQVSGLTSPLGPRFFLASFADTRIPLPGVVNGPLAAIVARG